MLSCITELIKGLRHHRYLNIHCRMLLSMIRVIYSFYFFSMCQKLYLENIHTNISRVSMVVLLLSIYIRRWREKNQIEFDFCILSLTYNNLYFFHLSFLFLNSSFLCRLKWVTGFNTTSQSMLIDHTEGDYLLHLSIFF